MKRANSNQVYLGSVRVCVTHCEVFDLDLDLDLESEAVEELTEGTVRQCSH